MHLVGEAHLTGKEIVRLEGVAGSEHGNDVL
jgi:hypothetical protein